MTYQSAFQRGCAIVCPSSASPSLSEQSSNCSPGSEFSCRHLCHLIKGHLSGCCSEGAKKMWREAIVQIPNIKSKSSEACGFSNAAFPSFADEALLLGGCDSTFPGALAVPKPLYVCVCVCVCVHALNTLDYCINTHWIGIWAFVTLLLLLSHSNVFPVPNPLIESTCMLQQSTWPFSVANWLKKKKDKLSQSLN
jgi:hypothetical protein